MYILYGTLDKKYKHAFCPRLNFFGSNGTPAGTRPNRWKLPTDIRAFFIDRAKASSSIKKVAIPAVFLGEHEELGSLAVAADDAFFDEALGEFFDGAEGFIRGDDVETNQVRKANFDGHGATPSPTSFAHSFSINFPG